MKIENQVCTLEQAKKLKELGIKGTRCFFWCSSKLFKQESIYHISQLKNKGDKIYYFDEHTELKIDEIYLALTNAELGECIPDLILWSELKPAYEHLGPFETRLPIEGDKFNGTHFLRIMDNSMVKYSTESNNEAHARAEMLIYLLERELITPEEVNERLLTD